MSVGILVQALQQYEGTFLLVSHDRHFISQVANKIWWIEDQKVKEYPGTFEEFNWWWDKNRKGQAPKSEAPKTEVKKDTSKVRNNAEEQQAAKEVKKLEAEIEALETKIADLERHLADPKIYEDPAEYEKTNSLYQKHKKELDQLMEKWEEMV